MKYIICFICLLSLPTHASVYVETDLKFGMQIKGGYTYKSGGFIGIGRSRKNKNYHHNHYAYSANGKYTSSSQLNYVIAGSVSKPESLDDLNKTKNKSRREYKKCAYELSRLRENGLSRRLSNVCQYILNPKKYKKSRLFVESRKSKVNINIEKKENISTVKLTIDDNQLNETKNFGGDHTAQFFKDTINGTIRIGFKMPKDTWAIIVRRKDMNGVFSGQVNKANVSHGLTNSLNQSITNGGIGEFIVWGKPETEISQDIVFSNYSQGTHVQGHIELEFETIDMSDLNQFSTSELTQTILEESIKTSEITDFNELIVRLKPLLFMHKNNKHLNTFLASNSTLKIMNFIEELNSVGYNADLNSFHWDTKAAAAILTHEIALKVLSSISVFCKKIEIELLYSKKKAKVFGLNIASYLIDKSRTRLSTTRFSLFDSILEELKGYQRASLTYSQVRNNPELFQPLYKAYKLIIETVDMRYSIYEDIKQKLTFVLDQFGSLGAPGKGTHDVMSAVEKIQNKDTHFYDSLLEALQKFQPDNGEKVNITSLVSQLNDLKSSNAELFDLLNERVKAGEIKNGKLKESILKLITFNVDIFTQEYKYKYFDDLRSNYINSDKVNSVLNSVKKCVGE